MRSSGGMTLGKTLAVIGVAVGMGVVGMYFLDVHSHVCSNCGRKWRHLGMLSFGDAYAHECPDCKTVQWWRQGHEAERSKLFADDVLGGAQKSARGMFAEGAPPVVVAPIPLEPPSHLLSLPTKTGG